MQVTYSKSLISIISNLLENCFNMFKALDSYKADEFVFQGE